MITHKISQHVRSQNWIAVCIDLIVVIFGVFLGLQANEWNENRNDRSEEKVYLARVMADVDETIRVSEVRITLILENIARTNIALDAIQSGRIEPEIAEQVGESLYYATRTSQIAYSHATLTEMVSTGKLGLVQNRDLRSELSDLFIWPEQMERIVGKPEEQKAALTLEKIGFYTARRYDDGRLEIKYDADWIIENPRVFQVLSNMQTLAGTTLDGHRDFVQRYYDIRNLIAAELDVL